LGNAGYCGILSICGILEAKMHSSGGNQVWWPSQIMWWLVGFDRVFLTALLLCSTLLSTFYGTYASIATWREHLHEAASGQCEASQTPAISRCWAVLCSVFPPEHMEACHRILNQFLPRLRMYGGRPITSVCRCGVDDSSRSRWPIEAGAWRIVFLS